MSGFATVAWIVGNPGCRGMRHKRVDGSGAGKHELYREAGFARNIRRSVERNRARDLHAPLLPGLLSVHAADPMIFQRLRTSHDAGGRPLWKEAIVCCVSRAPRAGVEPNDDGNQNRSSKARPDPAVAALPTAACAATFHRVRGGDHRATWRSA